LQSRQTPGQRLRLIVLIAVTTGMRASEIFGLNWSDVMYSEGLLAVRAKLKGGKMRYVPILPEVADELRRFPAVIGEDRIFPPKAGAASGRQCVEGSFEDLLKREPIRGFRFHDLRHTASASLSADAAVLELAEAKRMPSPREQIHRACSLAPIIPESRPDRERITQADVEREIESRRAERA
jgi:integrase